MKQNFDDSKGQKKHTGSLLAWLVSCVCCVAFIVGLHTHAYAQSGWKQDVLRYVHSLAKTDGGYGWIDQPDSHLTPTFAVAGILYDIDQLPGKEDRQRLTHFIRMHHPQFGADAIRALLYKNTKRVTYLGQEWKRGEAGASGSAMRDLVYQQIQSILWLGDRTDDFNQLVSVWKSQAGNIANYEKHKYPVLFQEMMTPVCRYLLGIPFTDSAATLSYLQSRRRDNGSFNNAPAADGGDGNMLNTYWSLYALQILGKENIKRNETVRWLQSCQLSNGGFTHQPHPVIGANDEVVYTWAAIKSLQFFSAKPKNVRACIDYLLSLRNDDGGFGNRPGLPSTPMSTYYAIDALKALDAFPSLAKAAITRKKAVGNRNDLSGLHVYTVQFEAPGVGSPSEAVMLADSLHVQLWGCKNGPSGWINTAQKIADKAKVPVTFFVADEPYGKYIHIDGMGTFGHILDFMAPADARIPRVGNDPTWRHYEKNYIKPLQSQGGALLLQISNNEPLARLILDESIKNGGYRAISTIHFDQNFLFWLPYLYQYRYQLPFIALQDAHGSEAWWWTDELLGYRTLFLAREPTYDAMMEALKKNRVVAVRHDSLSGFRTRLLGGAPGVQEYVLAHEKEWKWWGESPEDLHRPWAAVTLIRPADSLESNRPETGVNIRVRCWRKASRPLLKEPVVTLKELKIDNIVVTPEYVEKKDRRGRLADSYYLYTIPDPAQGEHTIEVTLIHITSAAQKVLIKKFSIPESMK